MRRRVAVVADKLDGGGEILPYEQKLGFSARGHNVALIGGMAYCDVCKSKAPITKAGGPRRIFYRSVQEVALDGDIVRCRCATPRRIVATLAMETWHEDHAERYAASSTGPECYDEQFTLLDENRRPLAGISYALRYPCGSLVHGLTDSAGRTARHRTMNQQTVTLSIRYEGV